MNLEKYYAVISIIALCAALGAWVLLLYHVVHLHNKIGNLAKEVWELMRKVNAIPNETDLIVSVRKELGEEIHTALDWNRPVADYELKKANAQFLIEIVNRILVRGYFYFRPGDAFLLPGREGVWTIGADSDGKVTLSNGAWVDVLGDLEWNHMNQLVVADIANALGGDATYRIKKLAE